jgi:hypothetical protein
MGGMSAYRALVTRPEGNKLLARPRIDGRIILEWVFLVK